MTKENMNAYDEVLIAVQKRIEELLNEKTAAEKRMEKAPAGDLACSRSHSSWQWYKTLGHRGTKSYLSRKKKGLIKQLAQKKYDSQLLKELHLQLDTLDDFCNRYRPEGIAGVLDSFRDAWKEFIEPVPIPDAAFVEMWLAKKYRGKKFADDVARLRIEGGVRVRSKSEIIIAEELKKLGVPFKYEFPYAMRWEHLGKSQMSLVHPDFTCLNVRTRQEFVWEHFGMMDVPSYANDAVEKIENFGRNGFFLGENLIVSMETNDHPMIPEKAKLLAQKYLL